MKFSAILLISIIFWALPVMGQSGQGGDRTQAIVLSEEDSGKSFTVSDDTCIVIQLEGESGSTGASFAPPGYDASVLAFLGKFNKAPLGAQGRVGWAYRTFFIFRVKRPGDTAITINLFYPAGPNPFDRHYIFHLKGKAMMPH